VNHPFENAGDGGTGHDRGVLIADVEASEVRSPGPSRTSESAPLIFATASSDALSARAAMLASVNHDLDDRIYFLVDDVREDA
jgi:hypothetical protein